MDKIERIRLAAEIFHEHGPLIRQLIRRYVHDENNVDDIYQDIFLSLVVAPPSSLTFLPAYLRVVVKNQVTDAMRRATSYGSCIERYARLRVGNTADNHPAARIIHKELTQMLILLVRLSLPSRMADIMLQRYVHDRDTAEIAERFGIKRRTVSRYCCVASQRVRRAIDEKSETAL